MVFKLYLEAEKKLQDVNWVYSWFDSALDEIISSLFTLKKEYTKKSNPKKHEIFDEYADILSFKLKEVYDTVMELHNLILDTSIRFYRKHHGPFRDQLGEGIFEEVKRNVTYSLESFLTQMKSLIDLSIKFSFLLATVNTPTTEHEVDSLGNFDHAHRSIKGFNNTWNIIKKSHFFSDFVTFKLDLFKIQNFRDLIVHESYLRLQILPSLNNGEISFRYKMPRVSGNKRQRKISKISYIDVIEFSREAFYLILSILVKLAKKLFDSSIKKKHASDLLKLPHGYTMEILRKMAKKGKTAEKMFLSKRELKKFLKLHKIDPSELVEYKTENHEFKSKFSDWIDKTEFIHFAPINGIEVYKVRSLHGRPNDTKMDKWNYGILKTTTEEEDYSKIPQSKKILSHLQGCGLVYSSSNNPNTYGLLREDLNNLISEFEHINMIKWSSIQIEEVFHIRAPNSEEIEVLKKIHGDKYKEELKRLEEKRKGVYDEYLKWKRDPWRVYGPMIIEDQNHNVLNRIHARDFKEEEKLGFVNWNANRHVITDPVTLQKTTIPLVPNEIDPDWLQALIKDCKKKWKRGPYNYLNNTKREINKHKKEYAVKVEKIKTENKNVIKRYAFLKPILKLINYDVYEGVDFSKVNAKSYITRK
ncbi:MAG: hypothetical protein ACREBB_04510 [Nitrosotalea sp.]